MARVLCHEEFQNEVYFDRLALLPHVGCDTDRSGNHSLHYDNVPSPFFRFIRVFALDRPLHLN